MRRRQGHGRDRRARRTCLSALALLMLIVVGCGTAPRSASPTATTQALPSPTATPMPTATATATRAPTATPMPRPTATPSLACAPAPGVQPVSAAVVRYGNTSRRQVSLTFDSDGGSAGNANQLLDILHNRQIRASWFVTGAFAQANPGVVQRIRNQGHDIGNHTVDHANLIKPPRTDGFVCWEITQADRMISAVSGRTTRPFFRPPYGDYNDQVRLLAAHLGYRTIYWSIDPRDWDPTVTAQDILNRVLNSPNLKPGAIILMHVNSPHEAEALNGAITGLEQRGYGIVPLSELLR